MTEGHEAALQALLKEIAATGYAFIPPTPDTHARVNARGGNEQARDLIDVFGWNRPFDADLLEGRLFEHLGAADALDKVGELWKSRVRIATLAGRHYLHSAFPTLAENAVFFGPDTYRFVRAARFALPQRDYARAIDIGCGSGAGGLALAAERDIRQLWLSDINPHALSLARVNARHQNRVANLVLSDLFNGIDGAFDLILANPPYLADPAHRTYRDGGGCLGTGLGLRIACEGLQRLAPGGVLFLYTGAPIIHGMDQFRASMEQISPNDGFLIDYDEIDPDVFGEELDSPLYTKVDRIAVVALKIVRLGNS